MHSRTEGLVFSDPCSLCRSAFMVFLFFLTDTPRSSIVLACDIVQIEFKSEIFQNLNRRTSHQKPMMELQVKLLRMLQLTMMLKRTLSLLLKSMTLDLRISLLQIFAVTNYYVSLSYWTLIFQLNNGLIYPM